MTPQGIEFGYPVSSNAISSNQLVDPLLLIDVDSGKLRPFGGNASGLTRPKKRGWRKRRLGTIIHGTVGRHLLLVKVLLPIGVHRCGILPIGLINLFYKKQIVGVDHTFIFPQFFNVQALTRKRIWSLTFPLDDFTGLSEQNKFFGHSGMNSKRIV